VPRIQFAELKRSGLISLRLRAWEKDAIDAAALACGESTSEFLRRVALAEAERRVAQPSTGDANTR
jgi:uncharacterized protein (DUF1778 family)